MPRQARIVVPYHLHHVTQRGNYRQNIFEEDADRIYYLKLIEEYRNKYHNDIFAFCLMNNHVHFIIRPQNEKSLAGIFCRAHQRYSLYFHKKKNIKGHLWQERFYSCLLQGSHIETALRYVNRNPVRAGIVSDPWQYTWSSARAHMGEKYNLVQLADIREYIPEVSWKSFLSEKENEETLKSIRETTAKGLVLGTIEFVKELEEKLSRAFTLQPRGRPKSKRPSY